MVVFSENSPTNALFFMRNDLVQVDVLCSTTPIVGPFSRVILPFLKLIQPMHTFLESNSHNHCTTCAQTSQRAEVYAKISPTDTRTWSSILNETNQSVHVRSGTRIGHLTFELKRPSTQEHLRINTLLTNGCATDFQHCTQHFERASDWSTGGI